MKIAQHTASKDVEGLKKIQRYAMRNFASGNKLILKDELMKFSKETFKEERKIYNGYINKIYGNNNKLTYLDFVKALRKIDLKVGQEWIIDPKEKKMQTTQRLVADDKANKTINVFRKYSPIYKILKKYANTYPDAIKSINSIAGHFENSAGFLRYSKVAPNWIHIDAIQTDFFNKVRAYASNNKKTNIKKMVSELLSVEDEVYKSAMSWLIKENPNVKMWTMNTPYLIKKIEHVSNDDKASSLYGKMAKKLGFKVITFNKLEQHIVARETTKLARTFLRKIGTALQQNQKNDNSIFTVYTKEKYTSKLIEVIRKTGKKYHNEGSAFVDMEEFAEEYLKQNFHPTAILATSGLAHQVALITPTVGNDYKDEEKIKNCFKFLEKKYLKDINNENKEIIYWANKGMLNEDIEKKLTNVLKEESTKKYELVKERSIVHKGHTLYRIRYLNDDNYARKGFVSGYIESEKNLSQDGMCVVIGNAKVYGNARVEGNTTVRMDAEVYENTVITSKANIRDHSKIYGSAIIGGSATISSKAEVYGNARVYERAEIYGNAKVYGNVKVYGTAKIYRNAEVYGTAKIYGDAEVSGNAKVYGDAEVFNSVYAYGKAEIFGNAQIFGKAEIFGNAHVYGTAKVYGGGWICNDDKFNKGNLEVGYKEYIHDKKMITVSKKMGKIQKTNKSFEKFKKDILRK